MLALKMTESSLLQSTFIFYILSHLKAYLMQKTHSDMQKFEPENKITIARATEHCIKELYIKFSALKK